MNHKKLVRKALRKLRKEGAKLTKEDGKTIVQINPVENPWHTIKKDPRMRCLLWETFFYGYILGKLPKEERFVPSHCANCWKVVVRPKTYLELLDVEGTMKSLDYPSKCGIDRRIYVKGLYGGYFYTRGKKKGLERLKEVREHFPSAILKRSCTEFEMNHGPSDKWEVTPKQLELERVVGEMVDTRDNDAEQDIGGVYQKWMDFAYKFDPTFQHELFPKCVEYED